MVEIVRAQSLYFCFRDFIFNELLNLSELELNLVMFFTLEVLKNESIVKN